MRVGRQGNMNYSEAKEYVRSFINNERVLHQLTPQAFSLKNTRKLLDAMDNFHKGLKVVHIAGSKGKGSTAVLSASILKEAGYTVGLYTSPHINDVRERIRILSLKRKGSPSGSAIFPDAISPRAFAAVVSRVKEFIDSLEASSRKQLTFFEVCTVAALYYFVQERVDWVILETGLGGRLDATNVVDATISAITTITCEHTHLLGKTLTRIAKEKAAIIKKSTRVAICAPQLPEVQKVIQARCRVLGFESRSLGTRIKLRTVSQNRQKQTLQLYYDTGAKKEALFPEIIELPLLGDYQQSNLLVVLEIARALDELGCSLNKEKIRAGIRKVFWPLRNELVSQSPLIWLDAAHTHISAQQLAKTVKEVYPTKKVSLIVAIASDKDVEGICKELNFIADTIYFTRFQGTRSFQATENFCKKAFAGKEYFQTKRLKDAFALALRHQKKNTLILVTGSIFIASEARRLILKNKEK